jgi:hypothetical protein
MFEFKHNFRLTIFERVRIERNMGYFLEMTPTDTKQTYMFQRVRFMQSVFYNNTVMNNGMMHVNSNAELEVESCNFTENYGFGRGVIIYSEFLGSKAYINKSLFIRNSGHQGGVFYV